MSASSINRAANDPQLQARIVALANKEVLSNEELANTEYGKRVLNGMAIWTQLYWPVAVETEAAYESALLNDRGAPGYDVDIITDAALSAAIVGNWPPDPEAIAPTTPARTIP